MKRTEAEQQEVERVMNLLKKVSKTRCELTKEESLAVRDAIMKYEEVASEFFFKTISPMIWGFMTSLGYSYGKELQFKDLATMVYSGIYDNGRWSRIRGYEGEGSFFVWMSRVGAQALVPQLVEYGVIAPPRRRTPANTSLTLRSMAHKEERQLVVELVKVPQLRKLLMCIYVARMTVAETRRKLGMSEEVFKKSFLLAQKILKEQLIDCGYYYYERPNGGKVVNLVSLALSDKVKWIDSDSIEAMYEDVKVKCDDDGGRIFLKERLETLYPGLPAKAQWNHFVIDFASKMAWSEEDKTVWFARFCEEESPVELADRLGHNRAWVDNHYSRLNKELVKAIRDWWWKV